MQKQKTVFIPAQVLKNSFEKGVAYPQTTVEQLLRNSKGTLAYVSHVVDIGYAISYGQESESFILHTNFAKSDYVDEFETLEQIFHDLALNYTRFKYIDAETLRSDYAAYIHERENSTVD